MLFPIISARSPASPLTSPPIFSTGDAKANAETLAWFGTAYGRRVRSPDRAETSGTAANLSTVVDFSKAAAIAIPKPRGYAPLVVLGGVLIALFALRAMPLAPPPALDRVHDPLPIEAAPHIEALQQPAQDAPAARADAEQLARDASEEAEKLKVAPAELPRVSAPDANLAAPSNEAPIADITTPTPTTPLPALPPAVPLSPVTAPAAEARLAAAPAPAPISKPDPVTVTEGQAISLQPSPVVKANLPTVQRPAGAPPLSQTGNRDLIAGQAHLAEGNLPAARAAFAKAFETGLPEAALALGNTFDPVSLAKVGLKEKGDPQIARRWYRRAFELAMSRPAMPRPAMSRPTMSRSTMSRPARRQP